MKHSLLLVALAFCVHNCTAQIPPFNKSFNTLQTKNWITSTLAGVVKFEEKSLIKPSFSFNGGTLEVDVTYPKSPSNSIPITRTYTFPTNPNKPLNEVNMCMRVTNATGQPFILLTDRKNKEMAFSVAAKYSYDEIDEYILDLNNAFLKLDGYDF